MVKSFVRVPLTLAIVLGAPIPSTTQAQKIIYNDKTVIDASSIPGVDCTGASDSAVALNSLTGNSPATNGFLNGKSLIFPPLHGIPCQIRLEHTWLIKNQSAFKLDGLTRSGANGGPGRSPTISWGGASGEIMIDMEYVDGFEVTGLAINGANTARVGINVDKTGTGGTVNTTDGIFRNLTIHAAASGGNGHDDWIGLALSLKSTVNVEDMRVYDSMFYCGGAASNQTGISIGSSANAKNEIIDHTSFTNCHYGVVQGGGSVQIRDGEFEYNGGACGSGTGADIELGGNSDTDIIRGNLDENGTQFISTNDGHGLSAPVIVAGNHWGPASCFNPSQYWINPGTGANTWTIEGNSWDANPAQTNLIGTAGTGQAQIYERGNIYPNASFIPWWLQFYSGHNDDLGIQTGNQIFAASAQTGRLPSPGLAYPSPFIVFRGYYNGSTDNQDDYAMQSIPGAGFLIKHQQGTGRMPVFAFDGVYPGLNLVRIPTPIAPVVSAVGAKGSISYTYSLVAYSGPLNTPGSATSVVLNGSATLSSSDYNLIQFYPYGGATEYCVWLVATSGSANLGKIGCTSAIQNPTMNTNQSSGMAFGKAYASNAYLVGSYYQIKHMNDAAGDSSPLPTLNTTGILSLSGQIVSTVPTGTAPFTIASTTPVGNLTLSAHPQVYAGGILTTSDKIYTNTQSLIGGAATHTFSNGFTYTSPTTFGCTCTDQTSVNACSAVPNSTNAVLLKGTGSDVLWLQCIGH